MTYDFTTVLDRHGKDALAVESAPFGYAERLAQHPPRFEPIPMWVADMNFATVPTVQSAIAGRLEHGAFGYFNARDEYYESIIRWQSTHNGVTGLRAEHIGYENGVLGGVVAALNAMCTCGDEVLVHSPTYVGFTHALGDCGYRIVHSPLVKDADGVWRMDLADMEEKLRTHRIHAAILCSPHNPTGRVWERWELEQAMDLYRRYDVFVVSDEIWSDLTLFGNRHVPTQSVSEDAKNRTVALYAPSKTFNLAGLIGSYHIIYNRTLHDRVLRASDVTCYNHMNLLSMYALIGAYQSEGEVWLEELRTVLGENVDLACRALTERFEGIEVFRPQGTYMLFPDFSGWCAAHGKTMDELICSGYDAGVFWQDGRAFHGAHSIRLNLALPKSKLEEALDRLEKYVL